MVNYKITNTTNQLGRRDPNFNSVLDIEYIDGFVKKTFKLMPNQTVFMNLVSLPLSVHKMRIKNFVIVNEVSDSVVQNEMNKYIVVNNNIITSNTHVEESEESKQDKKSRKNSANKTNNIE